MYLLLTIYSFCNLNVISWGTREVTEKKSADQVAKEKAEAEEEAKKKALKSKSSIFGMKWIKQNITQTIWQKGTLAIIYDSYWVYHCDNASDSKLFCM